MLYNSKSDAHSRLFLEGWSECLYGRLSFKRLYTGWQYTPGIGAAVRAHVFGAVEAH